MNEYVFTAGMIEGELHLFENGIKFQSNRKAQANGWPPETWISFTDIISFDFKPGGFASGGHIKFALNSSPSNLDLNFSLMQSANAAVIAGGIEKRRSALKNPVLVSANGVNGQLELLEDRIRIKREGGMALLSQGIKGDKEIQLSSITSIQFRAPGGMTNGYIQFSFVGGHESKAALLKATQDENSVMFSQAQLTSFLQMKEAIEKQRAKVSMPSTVQYSFGIDDLEKLASLRDRGILTDEEFQIKKRQILGL